KRHDVGVTRLRLVMNCGATETTERTLADLSLALPTPLCAPESRESWDRRKSHAHVFPVRAEALALSPTHASSTHNALHPPRRRPRVWQCPQRSPYRAPVPAAYESASDTNPRFAIRPPRAFRTSASIRSRGRCPPARDAEIQQPPARRPTVPRSTIRPCDARTHPATGKSRQCVPPSLLDPANARRFLPLARAVPDAARRTRDT